MKIAVISGGAEGVWAQREAAKLLLEHLGIRPVWFAVNDAGTLHPDPLEHWCSVHNEHYERWKAAREANGLTKAGIHWGLSWGDNVDLICRTKWFRGGSSGLFAVDVALHGTKCAGAILCGVPMDDRPNAFTGKGWGKAKDFRVSWQRPQVMDVLRPRVRSFAGWTREQLGLPTVEWLRGLG